MSSESWLDHLHLIVPLFDVCAGKCDRYHVDTQVESEALLRALGLESVFPLASVQKVDVRRREPGDDLCELIDVSSDHPLAIRVGSELRGIESGRVSEIVDEISRGARGWTFFAVQDPTDGDLHVRFNRE